jgi:hypothetical protein
MHIWMMMNDNMNRLQLQYYKATRKAFREAYERQLLERALDSGNVWTILAITIQLTH